MNLHVISILHVSFVEAGFKTFLSTLELIWRRPVD